MNWNTFNDQGYILTDIKIPEPQLSRFREIAIEIEGQALMAQSQGSAIHGACVINDSVGSRLMRFDDLHLNYTDDLNKLLAMPGLLRAIKELCGPHVVILQADLLYKHQHPHPVIKWHQGAPSNHKSHYLNIGLYLDNADVDDGCLRYVPGTQHGLVDIDHVERVYGWNPNGVVQVPAKAGEVLIQEMMVLHSSEPKRSEGARRTIYVEARPYEAVKADAKQDLHWLELRRFWMAEILKLDFEGVFTAEERAFYEAGYNLTKEELMNEISNHHCPPIPAVYNFQDTTGPDYPIPSDLL